jgi:cell division GTPase FtsZ
MSEDQKPQFDIELPDIPLPSPLFDKSVKDHVEVSFKFAFIGSGQAGGRIAATFGSIGYNRVCAINTSQQDLATLALPAEAKMCIGGGGAGKNPGAAHQLFNEKREDVLDLMRRCFGQTIDRTFVCIGAGGGTGSGTSLRLIETVRDLQVQLKCATDKVGVIVSLPKTSEGSKVAANAYATVEGLLKLVDEGALSPLIILDNERIKDIYPGLAVDPFWATANQSVASLFHLFNVVSCKQSSYTTFDAADFQTVLDSGLIVFGATPLAKWSDPTDISYAIRENLKHNILCGGIDMSTGTVAGAVIIGGQEILSQVPHESLDHGFEQLTRLMRAGSTVHRGIYKGDKSNLVAYTAIGGLSRPAARLEELRKLGRVE